ncbi:MAG TPA: hypothetical protein VF411_07435, partial [Bacteroidia bacterium]
MNKLLPILLLFISLAAYAQPANDDCTGAVSLGTLPDPGTCAGTTQQNGAVITQAGTLVGATPENPYTIASPCSGGSMATPA